MTRQPHPTSASSATAATAASRAVLRLTCLCAAAWLTGCAPLPRQHDAPTDPAVCSASGLNPADNTRLAGIEQLVRDGKPYAALAQLDSLKSEAPSVKLTRADALRRIDRLAEAQSIYLSLTQGNGCLDGRAQHGLGLVAAQQGRLSDSVRHLQQARQDLPTDLRVRNDLGYALLLSDQLDAARFEFLTVLDLNDKEPRAARNLVLLTFKQGQPEKARELGKRLGLDADSIERLALAPLALAPLASTVTSPATSSAPSPAPSSASSPARP